MEDKCVELTVELTDLTMFFHPGETVKVAGEWFVVDTVAPHAMKLIPIKICKAQLFNVEVK